MMAKNKKISSDEKSKADMGTKFGKQQSVVVNSSTGASEQGKGGSWRSLLRAPKFGNAAKDRIAGLQYNILIGLFITGILGVSVSLAFWTSTSINGFGIMMFELLLSAAAFYWQRRGKLELTSWILVGTLYAIFILGLSLSGFTFTIALLLAIVISLAGLMLQYYSVIAVTVFTIITLWVLPSIVSVPVEITARELVYATVILALEGLILIVASYTLEKSFTDADQSTQALLHANTDLQVFNKNLEQRVAERTAKMERRNLDLALATEIGQTVSQVRAINDMLKDAAEIIRTFFGLYYVQVYLANESQTELVLQFGTGEVGAELMQRGHRLPLNEDSINGRAAVTKRSVVIANTANSAFFRPNPLLPNTHSEVAVPLLVGDTLVGVLDVQSEDADLLNEDALLAFEPMAGQMAVAIQNSRLIAETQQARAEVESLARRLTHAGWEDYLDAIHKPESSGFVFEQDNVTPLTGQEKSPAEDALVASIEVTGEKLGSLVVEFERASSISQTDELINTVARQVSQHIESLRLLDSAERFRYEAEQASRRLTHEGWQEFMEDSATKGAGYVYDLREVRSSAPDETEKAEMAGVSLPLKIRDEAIGKLILQGVDANDSESVGIANVVAERLSAHIEGLRLALQTEKALSTTKKQAQREQALRQITSAVRGSTDPATILRTAARELGAIMGRQTVVQLETATHEVHNNQAHVSADLVPDSAMTNENRYVPSVESSNGDDGGNK